MSAGRALLDPYTNTAPPRWIWLVVRNGSGVLEQTDDAAQKHRCSVVRQLEVIS